VLEAARRVVFKGENLDDIYNALTSKDSEAIFSKKKAIITVCATGKGGSIMAGNLIKSTIGENYTEEVEIIPLDYMTIENNTKYFNEVKQKYDIIACFGSMKPSNNQMPYFSINELFDDNIREKLINIIDTNISSNKALNNKNMDIYDKAKIMFDKYLLYLNSKMAIKYIKNIIKELDIKEEEKENDKVSNLVIHIGCMLNRIIIGDMIIFDNINYFIESNNEIFLKVKRAVKSTEDAFKIKISDDEICYIVKILQQF
jgi:transcriptional regulatory protein LevR